MVADTERRYTRQGIGGEARVRRLALLVAVALALAVLVSLRPSTPSVAIVPVTARASAAAKAQDARRVELLAAMVREVEATWRRQLPQVGAVYTAVRLVVGRDASSLACPGDAPDSDSIYCATDATVVLDLDETATLDRATQSFVVAHA
ncbi:MAG TPA: neutral zinc metallopeptidase, partial [Gemmatimonadales bacterium]|nr:neutral zinc metallopeptidase [Gemmatimonadales bacterium]